MPQDFLSGRGAMQAQRTFVQELKRTPQARFASLLPNQRVQMGVSENSVPLFGSTLNSF